MGSSRPVLLNQSTDSSVANLISSGGLFQGPSWRMTSALHKADHAPGERVVAAVAAGADGRLDAGLLEPLGVANRGGGGY